MGIISKKCDSMLNDAKLLKICHGTKANYLRVLDLSLAPKEKLLVLMD